MPNPEMTPHPFAAAGPLSMVAWPSIGGKPRYWLVYGALRGRVAPPTWGLATIDESHISEETWDRPYEITADALRHWLATITGRDVADGMVAAMMRAHPHLFPPAPGPPMTI